MKLKITEEFSKQHNTACEPAKEIGRARVLRTYQDWVETRHEGLGLYLDQIKVAVAALLDAGEVP